MLVLVCDVTPEYLPFLDHYVFISLALQSGVLGL